MKILLVGDYSGVHSELRNALRLKGFDVKLISDGDGYKGFPTDIKIKNRPLFSGKLGNLIFIITEMLGITGIPTFLKKWKRLKKEIVNYDVVQMINPIAFSTFGSIVNLFALRYIKKHNKKIFFCALGADYYWVKNQLNDDTEFNVLKDINLFNFYNHVFSIKYVYGFLYKTLTNYAINISEYIISGLYDYRRVYSHYNNIQTAPLPIDPSKIGKAIKFIENEKIVIFHGWQKGKEAWKGNLIFDKVANRICEEYPDKVEYQVVQNVPFAEYIKLLNNAHIAFDQCNSYDKGMNGVFLMAAGKVTLTGLDERALKNYPYYDAKKKYGINAKPNEEYLYDQVVSLIENPQLIKEISQNAIDFVTKNHSSDFVAEQYLNIWEQSNRL